MTKTIFNFAWLILLISINTYAQDFKIDTTKINQFLKEIHEKNQFDGIALIAYKDSIVYKNSFGYSNNELKTRFSDSTKFQIASLSKQFTSFGILILEQENKLSIDDYVFKHLPEFPFKNVKIKHLMSHTSGLPSFVNSMWKDLDTNKINGNEDMLLMLKSNKYPLQWIPGSKWEYSDIAYCTLATVIEAKSKINFKKFMSEKIFKPAGMTNTSAELSTDFRNIKTSNLAIGYAYDSNTNKKLIAYNLPKNNFIYWLGGFYGDGSVISTTKDLLKWDNALYEGKIIHPKTLKKAMTPTRLNEGDIVKSWWKTSYGLGWFLSKSEKFGKVQNHIGVHPGYRSSMTRCPEKHLTIIILSNLSIPIRKINLLGELEKQQ
jgi:CubicO group peptidase (beta-lactamase class C family)